MITLQNLIHSFHSFPADVERLIVQIPALFIVYLSKQN